MSRKRKRRKRLVDTIGTTPEECCFCHERENSNLGIFFKDEEASIAAHQFCLLFSAGLPQRGEDTEGFDGFLMSDIKKEVQRANKIMCKFCKQFGASSGCSVKTCRLTYHYLCGKKEEMQFVFFDTFDTYCHLHRSYQDMSYIKTTSVAVSCPLCLEDITLENEFSILKMPCCKNVFAHKVCIQYQATASGYFFKCPTCNNEELFQREMAQYGIYIPQRDASWEDNNAFSDLLVQYTKCDWPNCQCPDGRLFYDDDGSWSLLRCYHCGQSAVHKECLGQHIIPNFEYVCPDCNKVIGTPNTTVMITPEKVDERTKEHKKLLAELTAREDPVLLSSPVFASPIYRRKYNIRPCYILIQPLHHRILDAITQRKRRRIKTRIYKRILEECQRSSGATSTPVQIDFDAVTDTPPPVETKTKNNTPKPNFDLLYPSIAALHYSRSQNDKKKQTKHSVAVTPIREEKERENTPIDCSEVPDGNLNVMEQTDYSTDEAPKSMLFLTTPPTSSPSIFSLMTPLSKTASRIISCLSSPLKRKRIDEDVDVSPKKVKITDDSKTDNVASSSHFDVVQKGCHDENGCHLDTLPATTARCFPISNKNENETALSDKPVSKSMSSMKGNKRLEKFYVRFPFKQRKSAKSSENASTFHSKSFLIPSSNIPNDFSTNAGFPFNEPGADLPNTNAETVEDGICNVTSEGETETLAHTSGGEITTIGRVLYEPSTISSMNSSDTPDVISYNAGALCDSDESTKSTLCNTTCGSCDKTIHILNDNKAHSSCDTTKNASDTILIFNSASMCSMPSQLNIPEDRAATSEQRNEENEPQLSEQYVKKGVDVISERNVFNDDCSQNSFVQSHKSLEQSNGIFEIEKCTNRVVEHDEKPALNNADNRSRIVRMAKEKLELKIYAPNSGSAKPPDFGSEMTGGESCCHDYSALRRPILLRSVSKTLETSNKSPAENLRSNHKCGAPHKKKSIREYYLRPTKMASAHVNFIKNSAEKFPDRRSVVDNTIKSQKSGKFKSYYKAKKLNNADTFPNNNGKILMNAWLSKNDHFTNPLQKLHDVTAQTPDQLNLLCEHSPNVIVSTPSISSKRSILSSAFQSTVNDTEKEINFVTCSSP